MILSHGDDVPLHVRQGRHRRAHREGAVRAALASGLRTADIASKSKPVTTAEMGSAVVKAL